MCENVICQVAPVLQLLQADWSSNPSRFEFALPTNLANHVIQVCWTGIDALGSTVDGKMCVKLTKYTQFPLVIPRALCELSIFIDLSKCPEFNQDIAQTFFNPSLCECQVEESLLCSDTFLVCAPLERKQILQSATVFRCEEDGFLICNQGTLETKTLSVATVNVASLSDTYLECADSGRLELHPIEWSSLPCPPATNVIHCNDAFVQCIADGEYERKLIAQATQIEGNDTFLIERDGKLATANTLAVPFPLTTTALCTLPFLVFQDDVLTQAQAQSTTTPVDVFPIEAFDTGVDRFLVCNSFLDQVFLRFNQFIPDVDIPADRPIMALNTTGNRLELRPWALPVEDRTSLCYVINQPQTIPVNDTPTKVNHQIPFASTVLVTHTDAASGLYALEANFDITSTLHTFATYQLMVSGDFVPKKDYNVHCDLRVTINNTPTGFGSTHERLFVAKFNNGGESTLTYEIKLHWSGILNTGDVLELSFTNFTPTNRDNESSSVTISGSDRNNYIYVQRLAILS